MPGQVHMVKGPDIGTGDPTDGRDVMEWKSRYPDEARGQIRLEATYVASLFFASLLLILATWKGIPGELAGVTGSDAAILKKYCLFGFSGLLGGTIFCIKYLYRVVARGYWNVDRRLWRLFSPLTALGVAFAMGALIDASFISLRAPSSGAGIVGIGFLVGYFADPAVAKMHEIAEVLFGTTIKQKD